MKPDNWKRWEDAVQYFLMRGGKERSVQYGDFHTNLDWDVSMLGIAYVWNRPGEWVLLEPMDVYLDAHGGGQILKQNRVLTAGELVIVKRKEQKHGPVSEG